MKFLFALIFALQLSAANLSIYPPQVTLHHIEARHQLIAQGDDNGTQSDLTRLARWTSSNPAVASVDAAGKLTPLANGEVTIEATHNGLSARIPVRVDGMDKPFSWSFRNHVVPVLSKRGCNQGACHGALAGKNGFKLTLRGYDPDLDHEVLTKQSQSRRILVEDPERSLLLEKASFRIPHGGGQLLKKDSLEYRVVRDWIAAGALPSPANASPATEPEVVDIEVFPPSIRLAPNAEQQLLVRAKYSDGRWEDVTSWAKYTSNDEGIAQVDDATARVKLIGHGEASVSVWYASKVAYARLAVPYATPVDPQKFTSFPRRNYIDDLVLAKLRALNLEPSPLASDSMFLRRAYLDTIGALPTAEEAENFLADPSPDKRAKLVDHLLARDEFNDYWANHWSDLLLVSSRKLGPLGMRSFYQWIRDSVAANKPWDQFARDIFTASGSTRTHGALNYFVLHKDPIDITENVTQTFLGQRLTCARCHNHPLEKWTQKQYYQMANLFARVGVKNGEEPGENYIFAKPAGDVLHPRLLRPLPPAPLDGQALRLDDPSDRRHHFAQWLTSRDNASFSRNLVNRVWGNFFGRGLTNPVDDVRATNPASNEELFSALVKDFSTDFDVRRLIRTILLSGTYQLSSDPTPLNAADTKFLSHYIPKRLPAEVLLDSFSQVTGSPTAFDAYPAGTRAIQLPDVQVKSEFLNIFGRPKRIVCDAGERSSEPSVAQALHIINGETLNQKLLAPQSVAALYLKLGLSDTRTLEHIYLSAFSRFPTAEEKQRAQAMLTAARQSGSGPSALPSALIESRRQALEDLLWALLSSKEFLFNQ
ncbi:MAG: DUF1549 domain-containing protein [Bryobacter sp.]|nr:DUF1549 domain-containing protein [Bryobacter sp.]